MRHGKRTADECPAVSVNVVCLLLCAAKVMVAECSLADDGASMCAELLPI